MAGELLITNGMLVDGLGNAPKSDISLLINEGEIVEVGNEADFDLTADLERIDATGKTIMPGLIDSHLHCTFDDVQSNDELFFHRDSVMAALVTAQNLEKILPGSLLEIELLYLEKNNLGIPDTALLMEGNKTFVYKVIENNMIKKIEVKTGVRDQGNLEVISGLSQGDKVVAEGLSKVRPNMKIKPIIKTE